jgi:predicted transcriptional regulator
MTAIKEFIKNSVSMTPKMFHFTNIIPSNWRLENFRAYLMTYNKQHNDIRQRFASFLDFQAQYSL